MAAPPPAATNLGGVEIRNVWEANLEEEFTVIRYVIDAYPFVAMDTEFPGTVVQQFTKFPTLDQNNYATLAANVNLLKLIQLGLTLSDGTGALPPCGTGGRACIWQFNFRGFNPLVDPFKADSVDLLRRSGIDFDRLATEGVEPNHFSELMMSSGVVLNPDVQWITFHSPYDFGYLLRLLIGQNLPETMDKFFELTKVFFPVLYDIKHLMKFADGLYGGLNKLSENLGVKRVGISHQAGSDSLLTLRCFMKLKDGYLKEPVRKYAGVLYGLDPEAREKKPPPLPH